MILKIPKKIILAIGALSLLLTSITMLVLSRGTKQPYFPSQIPIPTPIKVSSDLQERTIEGIPLENVFPQDKSSVDPRTLEIILTLKSSPTQAIANQITLSTTPQLSGNYFWSNDYTKLVFIPSNQKENTLYSARLLYKNEIIYSWTFNTISVPKTLEEDLKKQAALEEQLAKERAELLREKPWVTKLPIVGSTYTLVYNEQDGKITVSLSPRPPIYEETKEDVIQEAKDDALRKLRKLGIDPTKENIEWIAKD